MRFLRLCYLPWSSLTDRLWSPQKSPTGKRHRTEGLFSVRFAGLPKHSADLVRARHCGFLVSQHE